MFVTYQDKTGAWRWRFVAANGRIMADSGEGYCSEFNANRAIRRFRDLVRGIA